MFAALLHLVSLASAADPAPALDVPRNRLCVGWATINLRRFSQDGKRMAVATIFEPLVAVWDVTTGKELFRSKEKAVVNALAFSADGKLVATGSYDRVVKVWDVAAGKAVHTFEGHAAGLNRLAFLPDGKALVSGDHAKVKAWRRAEAERLTRERRPDLWARKTGK